MLIPNNLSCNFSTKKRVSKTGGKYYQFTLFFSRFLIKTPYSLFAKNVQIFSLEKDK